MLSCFEGETDWFDSDQNKNSYELIIALEWELMGQDMHLSCHQINISTSSW
jgi:hypothetical protein